MIAMKCASLWQDLIFQVRSLDELMRHVEALRAEGNKVMCEHLNMSAKVLAADTTFLVCCSSLRTLSGGSRSKREDPDPQKGDR